MAEQNNPAGRLFNLILQGKKYDRQKPAREVWATMFDIPKDDFGRLWRLLTPVAELPKILKERVALLPKDAGNKELLLKWLPQVEGSFRFINLDVSWAAFLDPLLRPEIMYGIEVCSDQLSRNLPDPVFSEQDLAQVLGEIKILQERVEKSDVDSDLKLFVLEQLRSISESLKAYPVVGCNIVKQTIESSIGTLATRAGILEKLRQWQDGRDFVIFLGKFLDFVAKADRGIQIMWRLSGLLGFADSGSDLSPGESLDVGDDMTLEDQTTVDTHPRGQIEI